jgi:hypothetical protein
MESRLPSSEKPELFLKIVSEVLTRVRNARAQLPKNHQLGLVKAEVEARATKTLADIANFDSGLGLCATSTQDAQSQAAIDHAAAERLERQAAVVRKEEWLARREAAALQGERIVRGQNATLLQEVERARMKYVGHREEGREKLQAVAEA